MLIFMGLVLISLGIVFAVNIMLRRQRAKASNQSLMNTRDISAEEQTINALVDFRNNTLEKERRHLWYLDQWEKPEFQDLEGWLSIPTLEIETPLFAKENDYWYYTAHNRFGERTAEGEAGILEGNRNTIIWDHSFIDGTRFQKLANWPDSNSPLEVWLEFSDGDLKHYQLAESRYLTGDEFFQWDFASEGHWHNYLEHVVGLPHSTKPENLLTIYTCHTHDAIIKSVLWFVDVDYIHLLT